MDMVDLADLITYHKGIDTDILLVHSLLQVLASLY